MSLIVGDRAMAENLIPVIGVNRLRMGIDGIGVRTLVATYGCPLRCKYCLNPHSWNPATNPKRYTAKELYNQVAIDSLYFQATNGGITFGGGEPLMHIDGIGEFAELCPDSWSIWAETSLYVDPATIIQASDVIDHFIVDIKSTNSQEYHAYTGQPFERAFDNLLLLKSLVGCERISIRVPLIPEYVTQESQANSFERLSALGFRDIELFTYKTDIQKLRPAK